MKTTQIWNEFNERLTAFIRSRSSDRAEVDDILQEVFIKVHLHIASLENGTKLTSWLYQITRNTIIDYHRKKKLVISDVEIPDYAALTVEEGADFTNCIRSLAAQLPAPYKEAIDFVEFKGISQKEYASMTNVSYSGAKSRVQRGRTMLKEAMVKCCAITSDRYGNLTGSKGGECRC